MKWKLWKKSRNWERSKEGKLYIKQYHQVRTGKLREQVFNYYGWHCNCCKERLITMLTIDHVNNDGFKDRKLRLSGARMYKKIIKQGFPDIYQVLCMNCNWSKRINKGTCEHKKP